MSNKSILLRSVSNGLFTKDYTTDILCDDETLTKRLLNSKHFNTLYPDNIMRIIEDNEAIVSTLDKNQNMYRKTVNTVIRRQIEKGYDIYEDSFWVDMYLDMYIEHDIKEAFSEVVKDDINKKDVKVSQSDEWYCTDTIYSKLEYNSKNELTITLSYGDFSEYTYEEYKENVGYEEDEHDCECDIKNKYARRGGIFWTYYCIQYTLKSDNEEFFYIEYTYDDVLTCYDEYDYEGDIQNKVFRGGSYDNVPIKEYMNDDIKLREVDYIYSEEN